MNGLGKRPGCVQPERSCRVGGLAGGGDADDFGRSAHSPQHAHVMAEGAQLPLPLSDYALSLYQIELVHANNITVRARVSPASGTAGATFKLRVTVRV